MACKHTLLAVLALLAVGAVVVPQVYWMKGTVVEDEATFTASIFTSCLQAKGSDENICHAYKFKKDDFKNITANESVALRDGAAASSILSGLFIIIVVLTTACSNKCSAVTFSLLQVLFSIALAGCLIRSFYLHGGFGNDDKSDFYLKDVSLGAGFYLAMVHFVASVGASIQACCMKKHDDYVNLEYA
jgi:hypothetical protein